jgi:hypothetical protein
MPKANNVEYNEDKVYVHLVPHSHNDLGWVRTLENYYSNCP